MSATSAAAPEASTRRGARMDPPPRRGDRGSAGVLGSALASGPGAVLRAVAAGARLTVDLMRDARVPAAEKAAALAALAYLVWPVDLIADVLPVVGQFDDLALLLWSWRRLLQAAGVGVIEDLWPADRRSLGLLFAAAGLDERPTRHR